VRWTRSRPTGAGCRWSSSPVHRSGRAGRAPWAVRGTPWYSSIYQKFYADCGVSTGFGLSVFLRDGDRVFRTYFTSSRGVDRLRLDFNLLDLTPFGRQENWEDSPAGRPQGPAYSWWRLHDEYAAR
jgi:Bacterial protein of unknown function (DUF899)